MTIFKKHRQCEHRWSFWAPLKKNKIHILERLKKHRAESTLQESLRMMLVAGQLFSLNPVMGIASKDAKQVRFIKTSWKCMYSAVSIFGQIFMTIMNINTLCNTKTNLTTISSVVFYFMTCVTMVMFVQIAKRWPTLVQHIACVEAMDPSFDNRLTYKCNITCAVILSLALLEHILSLLSAFSASMICYPQLELYEGFVKKFYPWVFDSLSYSPFLGIFTQFLHFQSTFIWNFSDLFVICISYYLTSRLNHVNRKLLAAQGKYLPEVFWRSTREDYSRATELVRRMDDVISGIVFVSFANNLFFICLQLFNTLEDGIKGSGECVSQQTGPLKGYETAAYFLFSLVLLISRSVAVSLIASHVNSASVVPAAVLYDVPSPVYCVEVQRFLDQVNGEKVALSGLQFFNVTRSLLLTVAGTIVTYELVMVQFNSPSSSSDVTTSAMTTPMN